MKSKLINTASAAGRGALASLPLLASLASPGYALDVYLKTGATTITPPGAAAPIKMWGYQSCNPDFTVCEPVSIPGPAISIPAGDASGLTVHLTNTLLEPTSLVIDGLPMPTGSAPVWDDGSSGPRTSATQRVRSLTFEAAASNGNATYSWPASAIKPGTFLYRSGTHMQVQDQMGLYGAVSKNTIDPALGVPGQLFGPSSSFDKDVVLLYSEIDPLIHAAVAGGMFGSHVVGGVDQCTLPVSTRRDLPLGWVCSTVNYEPKYFLVNGMAYDSGSSSATTFPAAGAYQKTLLRFLNAGLQTHVPVLTGLDMTLLAEDGNPYPYVKTQYSAFLPAMKTMDAIIEPQASGKVAVVDRMLNLTNNGQPAGGMLAYLDIIGSGPTPLPTASPTPRPTPIPTATPIPSPTPLPAPVAVADTFAVNAGSVSGNVLSNDNTDPGNAGRTLTAAKLTNPSKGAINFNANGAFTYAWSGNSAGTDSFTYRVNDGTSNSAPATVSLNLVNNPPLANGDSALVTKNRSLAISVLTNDSDPENNLNPAGVTATQPSQGRIVVNADGTITYTPRRNYVGADSFTYSVADKVGAVSVAATVNVCVGACPVADAYTAPAGAANFAVATPGVLANDAPANAGGTVAVVAGSLRRNGSTTLNGANLRCPGQAGTSICSNGAFQLNLPPLAINRPGIYSFTYRMTVGNATSTPTTVTITVP